MGLEIIILKQQISCPTCGALRCYEHCNFCGKKIYWKKDQYDDSRKSKMYESGTEIEHYGCMKNGTGKWLRVNNDIPNEYVWDKTDPLKKIVRCGNSPVFKCLYCNHRDDLPRMKEHHKKGWCKIKQNQEEWTEQESKKPIVKIGFIRLDEFIGAVQ